MFRDRFPKHYLGVLQKLFIFDLIQYRQYFSLEC